MDMLKSSEIAEKWGVSERSVRNYCAEGRIAGAVLIGKTWYIPADAVKPGRRDLKQPHTLLEILRDEMRSNRKGGIYRNVQNLVEEVISCLTDLEGCEVDIHLEVSAHNPDGFTVPIIRTVSENCRTLKVKDFSFEP